MNELDLGKVQFIPKTRFLFEPATPEHGRYKVLYGGRGSLKSWTAARALLIRGVSKKRRNKLLSHEKESDPIQFRWACLREIQNSIKESVHQLLSNQIKMMGLTPFYDVQQSIIQGKPGTVAYGTEFLFFGLRYNVEERKSMEDLDGAWIEEANRVSDHSWEVIIPTIRKDYDDGTCSEIWATFNPELETDPAYKRFVKSKPRNAIVVELNWRDNPWFPKVLEVERQELKEKDPDAYLTVYEGKTRMALAGAVFAKELREAREKGRVCKFAVEKGIPVNTYWDLGKRDHTAIWFIQRVGLQWRVIDFYQNNFEEVDHFLGVLQAKGYVYGTHYLPHDGKSKVLGQKRSVYEQIRGADEDDKPIRNTVVLPQYALHDQINALRSIFGNLWFEEDRTAEGLSFIGRYRWAVHSAKDDPSSKIYSPTPIHDDASHPASALMQFAMSAREPEKKRRPKNEDVFSPVFDHPQAWLGQ